MKIYKCNYCGRVFDKQMPHKCNHGFRKHKHSWTEIEDSDNEYQKVENTFTKEKQIYNILHSLYVDEQYNWFPINNTSKRKIVGKGLLKALLSDRESLVRFLQGDYDSLQVTAVERDKKGKIKSLTIKVE